MKTGQTTSGFAYSINENAFNDMVVLEAIMAAEEGEGEALMAFPIILNKILGKEGKKALYKHLETEDGRVPVEDVTRELVEIMQGCGTEAKN